MRLRNAISDNSSLLRENGVKRAITRFIPPGKRGDVRKGRNGSETSVTLSARVAVTNSGRQCFATLLRTPVCPGEYSPLWNLNTFHSRTRSVRCNSLTGERVNLNFGWFFLIGKQFWKRNNRSINWFFIFILYKIRLWIYVAWKRLLFRYNKTLLN